MLINTKIKSLVNYKSDFTHLFHDILQDSTVLSAALLSFLLILSKFRG